MHDIFKHLRLTRTLLLLLTSTLLSASLLDGLKSFDSTPPVLTLNGEANITLAQNTPYTELGATATDAVDGSVGVRISGSVDTATPGEYTLTYRATDSAGNGASVGRVVNVVSGEAHIQSLTIITPQTHYIRKRYIEDNRYLISPAYIPLKVMAMYDNAEIEEVTDRVTWNGSSNSRLMRFYSREARIVKKGDYTISASLDGVTNSIDIKVEDTTEKFLDVNMRNYYLRGYTTEETYRGKEKHVEIKLTKKPTSDVILKLKVEEKNAISFPIHNSQDSNNTHEIHTLRFTPEDWAKNHKITIYFSVLNSLDDYTIVTEPFESQDTYYDGKNAEDIVLRKAKVELIEPPIAQRRGAIRGVTILFQVQSKKPVVKYELVNPPKGMKIAGRSDFGYDPDIHGIYIEWKVPMDAIEGKTYTITVKGTDPEGNTQEITFPIKVPKTKPIQTKLVNNELIVTDKSSPLYGMKMKGHSGEDISKMKLRSVAYRDVWKMRVENRKPEDIVEHVVFILDDMPSALDVKMPTWMDTHEKAKKLLVSFLTYVTYNWFDLNFAKVSAWKWAVKSLIKYENYDGYLYQRGYNKKRNIFMLMPEKAQYKR